MTGPSKPGYWAYPDDKRLFVWSYSPAASKAAPTMRRDASAP